MRYEPFYNAQEGPRAYEHCALEGLHPSPRGVSLYSISLQLPIFRLWVADPKSSDLTTVRLIKGPLVYCYKNTLIIGVS